ncbi:MAG: hypothetical protein NTV86_06000 [Planctomycetota bacterium]|nr:hypothetical protein [Planctomycetota bacterium]
MTTFAHKEPDRVPIGYSANAGIDRRLREYLGLREDQWVGEAVGVDFRGVGAPYRGPRLHPEIEGRGVDMCWGLRTRWIEHESGGYWDYCDFPLRDADLDTIAAWPMPNPDDFDYSRIAEDCRNNKAFASTPAGPGCPTPSTPPA